VIRVTGRDILRQPLACIWPGWARAIPPEPCERCGQPVTPGGPRSAAPFLRVAWVEHNRRGDDHRSCGAMQLPHTRADCLVMRKAGDLVRGKITDEPDDLDLAPWDLGPATEVPPAEGPGR
jgi:hypothetical protein